MPTDAPSRRSPRLLPNGLSLVALVGLLGPALPGAAAAGDGPARWEAGPVVLEVHVSRTANLFHFVDQASGWSTFVHSQYEGALGELGEEDRQALARYAEIRERHGWGGGMEPTFYTAASLDDALAAGVRERRLPRADAEAVGRVLRRFEERFVERYEAELGRLEKWRESRGRLLDDLEDFARRASRLCGGVELEVPVHLIVSPSDHAGGGGFNGGRLTLEIPRKGDPYPTLLHEIFHAFLREVSDEIDAVHEAVPGLDGMTLNEGLCYALSPGLLGRTPGSDPLAKRVAEDFAAGATLESEYVRFHRLGLALRPFFEAAWNDDEGALGDVLARVPDVWRVVEALSPRPLPALYCSGPGYRRLGERYPPEYSTNHRAEHYEKILGRARPGDTYVFLFALDHPDRDVPEGYADLLPLPWARIEAALKRGEVVEVAGEARGLRTVVLAAPTVARLERLIDETDRLDGGAP